MEHIKFMAAYGDQDKEVYFDPLNNSQWRIFLGNVFYGHVVSWNGQWEVRLFDTTLLEQEDVNVIEERITRYEQMMADKPLK